MTRFPASLWAPIGAAASPARRGRYARRMLRSRMPAPYRDPYGLAVEWVDVDGRPVRSLSGGIVRDAPEVISQAGLGAPGYLVPWTRHTSTWTRATLLDLPGWHHGRARGCTPTLNGVAAAAARWLEITDRQDVVLLGHSTGAQAALHAALLPPGRVTGVVLAGPSFDPSARSTPRSLLRALATLPREPPGAAEAAVPSYLHSGGVQLLKFVRSALADHCENHVPHLAAPVLLLTGQRDPFSTPAWVRHLAELADAPWHVLEGAHMAQYTHPEAADALLRDAVRGWTTKRPRPSSSAAKP